MKEGGRVVRYGVWHSHTLTRTQTHTHTHIRTHTLFHTRTFHDMFYGATFLDVRACDYVHRVPNMDAGLHRVEGTGTAALYVTLAWQYEHTRVLVESKVQCIVDGWMDGWMNGWMNEWMNLWMNGWMDAGIEVLQKSLKHTHPHTHTEASA